MVSYYKALRMMKDKGVKNSTQQDNTNRRTIKTDTKTTNYRRLSRIELPCTLREGLRLDITHMRGLS